MTTVPRFEGIYTTEQGTSGNTARRLQFVLSNSRNVPKDKVTALTSGPKVHPLLSDVRDRRGRRICRNTAGECSICFVDGPVVSCPNKKCKSRACADCIIMYCTTNSTCTCCSCKYEYSCVDIRDHFNGSQELLQIKYSKFTRQFDQYMHIANKKLDISFAIETEWGVSTDHADALFYGHDRPKDVDEEWWLGTKVSWDTRTSLKTLMKTTYVDKCSSCTGGITDEWVCNRCSLLMCKDCGVMYKGDHSCNDADVKTRKELLENSKCCPHCSTRIDKTIGCDIMWCPACKIRFRWSSLEIITDDIHNPEHDDYLTKLYDRLSLRLGDDFNTGLIYALVMMKSGLSYKYTNNKLERLTMSSISYFIAQVIQYLIYLYNQLLIKTDISPAQFEIERLDYVSGVITKEEYEEKMIEHAKTCYLHRYYAYYVQNLIMDLQTEVGSFGVQQAYSIELLYDQFCRLISGYNKDFCNIRKTIHPESSFTAVLYDLLKNDQVSDFFYDVDSGIIIPKVAIEKCKDKYLSVSMKKALGIE